MNFELGNLDTKIMVNSVYLLKVRTAWFNTPLETHMGGFLQCHFGGTCLHCFIRSDR